MVPIGSLPAAMRLSGISMPVRDAVAQQMLEGAGHPVEDAAVDFDRATDDVESNLLAGFLAGEANHPIQAV